MKPAAQLVDDYFTDGISWSERLSARLPATSAFSLANASAIGRFITEDNLAIVVNVPADALIALLNGDQYRNCYELQLVLGATAAPSPTRIKVDRLLGFVPDGRGVYFAAVALGGTGVRFYGEYCLVLKRAATGQPPLFDRNSYDLTVAPLEKVTDQATLVQVLRGNWKDLPLILTLKVLAALGTTAPRLTTAGTVAEAVLKDEDFVEVHLPQTFHLADLAEIRQAPEDVALRVHLEARYRSGWSPSPADLVWSSRRAEVETRVAASDVKTRVVTTHGRGGRWK
jgi:hypothetical protein